MAKKKSYYEDYYKAEKELDKETIANGEVPGTRSIDQVIKTKDGFIMASSYLFDEDMRNELGHAVFSENEMKRLRNAFDQLPDEEQTRFNWAVRVYNALRGCGRRLWEARLSYQKESAILAGYCQLWDKLEKDAKSFADQLAKGAISIRFANAEEEANNVPFVLESKEGRILLYADGRALVDIRGEGMLWDKIQEQRENVLEELRSVKVCKVAIEGLVYGNDYGAPVWALLPLRVDNLLTYPDAIEFQDKRYFEETIRKREEAGENITNEERERAVFPDWEKITPTKEELQIENDSITAILSRYNIIR